MVAWEKLLSEVGLEFGATYGGGSCLFACIAEKVWTDGSAHPSVRELIVNWICANWDAFSREIFDTYSKSDPDSYRAYMMQETTEGSVIELQAYTRMTKDANFRLFFLNGKTTLIGGFQHRPVYNLMF